MPRTGLMSPLHAVGAPPPSNLFAGSFLWKTGRKLTTRERVNAALEMFNALRHAVFADQRAVIGGDATFRLRDLEVRHIYWLEWVFRSKSVPWRERVRSTIPLRPSAFAYGMIETDTYVDYRDLLPPRKWTDTFDEELGYTEGSFVSFPAFVLPRTAPPDGWRNPYLGMYTRNMNLSKVLEGVLEMLNELRVHVHGADKPLVRLAPIEPQHLDYIAHVFRPVVFSGPLGDLGRRDGTLDASRIDWRRYVYFTMPLIYNSLAKCFIEEDLEE